MQFLKLAFALFYTSTMYGQDCNDMVGKWINEQGSVLVIKQIAADGKIAGEYASSTGVDGSVFSLFGWVNQSVDYPDEVNIGFSVRWVGYGSITSWTGYCLQDEDGSRIVTVWNLVRSGKEFDWERIITNASTFISEGK